MGTETAVTFDANVFSLETVKRALYRCSDQSQFDITSEGGAITVTFSAIDPDGLADKIRNEVLDQDLRDTLSKETANVRTLILANAFSDTGLIR
ncbi:His-Xaa-Ser system protein HxsD [Methylovulum psychrotolerans]|uniref:His-Xaa-Ser system protein HxsD n=1 Tax=Methylovulum psychrotolerans TaxID=1704499 RepID=A0A2S5CIR5_9GAMM|nr:His-Xaa-Ser system protein HxsD [Methylovulum psychrotolerans]POZ50701.1 hypothetical protein AADEFJLK_03598 [Methylovulum psychrotolerans]